MRLLDKSDHLFNLLRGHGGGPIAARAKPVTPKAVYGEGKPTEVAFVEFTVVEGLPEQFKRNSGVISLPSRSVALAPD